MSVDVWWFEPRLGFGYYGVSWGGLRICWVGDLVGLGCSWVLLGLDVFLVILV